MPSLFIKIQAVIVSLIITIITSFNLGATPGRESFEAENPDELLLNAAVISDTHVSQNLILSQAMLGIGLTDMSKSKTPVDAVVVSGDITNMCDARSKNLAMDIFEKYSPAPAENHVIASGNHDVGHASDADITHEQARQDFIDAYNGLTGAGIDKIYYSVDINGFTFIVLGDEGNDTWDEAHISSEQLNFLDSELARATSGSKPAFVVCHQPLKGVNGQATVWKEGSLGKDSDAVQAILEKYTNVFFISGHMHMGFVSPTIQDIFGWSAIETINGVTYVNLPTYTLINQWGNPINCLGYQMEVYEDEIVFRARSYFLSTWVSDYNQRVELVK